MEYDVEDHWEVNDLPNEDHALKEREDTHEPAEECEDTHERQCMEDEHEKGDEAFFSCFAQEFSMKAAADILGIDATPFKHMKKH